jgi:deoxyribodipyrimidine photolyase-related protein
MFPEHPGDAADFWLPTTAAQAEDALSKEHPTVYHSVLSAILNIGLLTPSRVIEPALEHAAAHEIPLNSLEGFVGLGPRFPPRTGARTSGATIEN